MSSVHIGIPAYGPVEPLFLNSILAGVLVCREAGFDIDYEIKPGCSLVAKARNEIVGNFLKGNKEQLLFLDADMVFDAQDMLKLLQRPEPVVAGGYVKKDGSGEFTLKPVEPHHHRDGVWEVEFIATGFMKIRREVFETLKVPQYGETKLFFNCGINPEDGNYWGEDYWFCNEYRKAGGRVWFYECPLGHVGSYTYRGAEK